MVNIELDYFAIECANGHLNECINDVCKECGISLEDQQQFIDPYVESRKLLLENVLSSIENRESEYKKLKKEIKKSVISKDFYENEMEKISEYINILSDELSFDIFYSINMTQEGIKLVETVEIINQINTFIIKLYDLLRGITLFEPTKVFRNIHKRLLLTVIAYKESVVELIMATIALNIEDAMKLKDTSQVKLDNSTQEIRIFGSIFGAHNIGNSTDLFQNGELNYSAILGMVWQTSNEGTIEDRVSDVCEQTSYYFRSILSRDKEHYSNDDLLKLSIYKYVGTIAFDDESFFRKVNVAYKTYEKAFEKNNILVCEFLSRYTEKYKYMSKKLSDLSIAIGFVFGNNPSDYVLMTNGLKWYKDLCEGIYRDSMIFLLLASYIDRDKSFDIDELIEWTGFGDICGQFASLTKLKLNYFVEGVDSTIRHSEAHVDYDIDIDNQRVVLRNRQKKTKIISTKEYSFDDFFEQMKLLSETVYSSIAAFTVFLINNKFQIDNVDSYFKEDEVTNKSLELYAVLSLYGILINQENENDSSMELSGVYIGEVEQFSFESIRAVFAPLAQAKPHLTDAKLELSDHKGEKFGQIKVRTDYIINSINETGIKKDCWVLMYMLTTKIESIYEFEEIENKKDDRFMSVIFQFILPILKEIDNEKKRIIRTGKVSSIGFRSIIDLTKYVEMIAGEYLEHSIEPRLIRHFIQIFKNINAAINVIMQYNSNPSINLDLEFKKISKEMLNVVHCSKYLSGEISEMELFINYSEEGKKLYKNVTVNSPCPCGSGKKYKKCCKKYILTN
ncbi:SEC-C metal-binding domain-containing protein [Paenibacillus sp. NPDC058174]|uniref:SEC-C metal-binding domain-containing protein n=1 Tax=Paenibacillus sp. NPDC058174 TaxID=3346366 RepID=UPI0036DA2D59